MAFCVLDDHALSYLKWITLHYQPTKSVLAAFRLSSLSLTYFEFSPVLIYVTIVAFQRVDNADEAEQEKEDEGSNKSDKFRRRLSETSF